MSLTKLLTILLTAALLVCAIQALYLVHENVNTPNSISAKEAENRNRMELEYAQKLREFECEYERKKHLATGDTVFDRIFNTQDQTISDLIKRISEEALPDGWSCHVKVEEFTHFILLIYLPHNSEEPIINQVTSYLQPIMKYCSWWLSNVAVFDRRHKSYLFFDKPLLTRLKSGRPLSKEMAKLAANHGFLFTRFNSVTVDCEKYESHLLLPIEISGPNGVIGCRALLDTGASVTMVSSKIVAKTGWDNLQISPRRTFSTVNGTISCPIVKREVNIGGIRKNIEVAVNQQDALNLVGMNFFERMDYIVDFGKSAVYIWEK
jgi:predicted aspartyl protease